MGGGGESHNGNFTLCHENVLYREGLSQGNGAWGALAPQYLAKQLSLSQQGGQIMPIVIQGGSPPGFSDFGMAQGG